MSNLADKNLLDAELVMDGRELSDLRMFVAAMGTRSNDNPLQQFFREVQDLRTLKEVRNGTRLEASEAKTAQAQTLPSNGLDNGGAFIG